MRLAVWCGFLVLIAASPLVAQESTRRNRDTSFQAAREVALDLQRATLHRGPFYLLSSLEFSDIGFDQQFAIPTEEQTGGFGIGISAPQKFYFVPRRKTVFSIDAVPSYYWNSSDEQEDQFGYKLRADAQFFLNYLHLDFFAGQSDQLRSSTAEINRFVTLREREAGWNGEFKYSTRTSMTFETIFRDLRHPTSRVQPDDRLVTLLDREEIRNEAGFVHRTFPLTSLVAGAHYNVYDFTPISDRRDGRRTWVGGGFLFEGARTTLRVEGGPARLDFDDRTQKDFSGALGQLRANRTIGSRWLFQLFGQRDLDFSIYEGNNYYVLDRVGLSGDYQATRRLTLRAGSQWGQDTYDVPTDGIVREDTFAYSSVGWSYATRKLRGGFDVGYYDRSSNVDIDEVDGIRILVHLSFTP